MHPPYLLTFQMLPFPQIMFCHSNGEKEKVSDIFHDLVTFLIEHVLLSTTCMASSNAQSIHLHLLFVSESIINIWCSWWSLYCKFQWIFFVCLMLTHSTYQFFTYKAHLGLMTAQPHLAPTSNKQGYALKTHQRYLFVFLEIKPRKLKKLVSSR